jgi:hypothetical protein
MRRRKKLEPLKGIVYRSKYERRQAERLIKNGIVFEYETKVLEYLDPISNGECANCGSSDVSAGRLYTPDFYFPATGIYVETKGLFDQQSRRKMKNIAEQLSEDIRMVFQRDNWLTKKHSMNYSRWCELNGLECAIGDVPLEWTRNEVD